MKKGPWIAGGHLLRVFANEDTSKGDIDIWCRDITQYKEITDKLDHLEHASKITTTDNAATYVMIHESQTFNIQVIRRQFYSSPQEVIDSFDFTICQLITDCNTLLVGETTLADINSKTLRNNNYQIHMDGAISRYLKYLLRGYKPCPELVEFVNENATNGSWIGNGNNYDTLHPL